MFFFYAFVMQFDLFLFDFDAETCRPPQGLCHRRPHSVAHLRLQKVIHITVVINIVIIQ